MNGIVMTVSTPKRPWNKSNSQQRYNRTSFYNSTQWRKTRAVFLASPPHIQLQPINGIEYKNHWCVECWKENKITKTHTIDHIHRIEAGGDPLELTNLQGLCESHHAKKSAREGNERHKI